MQVYPLSCRKRDLLYTVASRMVYYGLHVLPVINKKGKVIGTVFYQDICKAISSHKSGELLWIFQIMDKVALLAHSNDTEMSALEKMRLNRSGHLFVVDEKGRLCGYIGFMTLARRAVLSREKEQREVLI